MKHSHAPWSALILLVFPLAAALSCGKKPAGFSGDVDAGSAGDGGTGSCVFDCLRQSDCTPDVGTKIDENRMSCAGDGEVCCALITGCDYECVPTGSCETGGGVIHADQTCAADGQVCCETPCAHECMAPSLCQEAGGTVHDEMDCDTPGDICCEPGSRYCQSPFTCVPPRDCDTGEERDGECVVRNQVCCLVARCTQNGGICRTTLCIPVLERAAPSYYCPGNQNCCK